MFFSASVDTIIMFSLPIFPLHPVSRGLIMMKFAMKMEFGGKQVTVMTRKH